MLKGVKSPCFPHRIAKSKSIWCWLCRCCCGFPEQQNLQMKCDDCGGKECHPSMASHSADTLNLWANCILVVIWLICFLALGILLYFKQREKCSFHLLCRPETEINQRVEGFQPTVHFGRQALVWTWSLAERICLLIWGQKEKYCHHFLISTCHSFFKSTTLFLPSFLWYPLWSQLKLEVPEGTPQHCKWPWLVQLGIWGSGSANIDTRIWQNSVAD